MSKKHFRVRMELGVIIEIGVDAVDERDAEFRSMENMYNKLLPSDNSVLCFCNCKIDDPNIKMCNFAIRPLEVYESEEK